MLNKLSFKFSWRALCLSIAVGTLLFTSCSMYKAGMENSDAGDGHQYGPSVNLAFHDLEIGY